MDDLNDPYSRQAAAEADQGRARADWAISQLPETATQTLDANRLCWAYERAGPRTS